MQTILITILILTNIITRFIIIDIVLSWLSLFFGKRLKINFISSIIEPCYKFIKKYIPTNIGPFDFTPIILFFALSLIQGLIFAYDPSIESYLLQFLNF